MSCRPPGERGPSSLGMPLGGWAAATTATAAAATTNSNSFQQHISTSDKQHTHRSAHPFLHLCDALQLDAHASLLQAFAQSTCPQRLSTIEPACGTMRQRRRRQQNFPQVCQALPTVGFLAGLPSAADTRVSAACNAGLHPTSKPSRQHRLEAARLSNAVKLLRARRFLTGSGQRSVTHPGRRSDNGRRAQTRMARRWQEGGIQAGTKADEHEPGWQEGGKKQPAKRASYHLSLHAEIPGSELRATTHKRDEHSRLGTQAPATHRLAARSLGLNALLAADSAPEAPSSPPGSQKPWPRPSWQLTQRPRPSAHRPAARSLGRDPLGS
eukprot:28882-Chlamydomonas_euryale.AAC.2